MCRLYICAGRRREGGEVVQEILQQACHMTYGLNMVIFLSVQENA